MHTKKVKLLCFSLRDSKSHEIELTWGKFLAMLAAITLVLFGFVSASLAFFTDFYQDAEMASLRTLNKHLTAQLADMGQKVSNIEQKVAGIETEDDYLRIIADLPKIDEDTRHVGVGGVLDVDYELPAAPKEVADKVFNYQGMLNKMERRLELTKNSREEIKGRLEEEKARMKHTSSIRPLIGGRINDKFGLRLHPLLDKVIHHKGVDIAAERGTEVFATAAGTIVKVVTKYKVNKGYGKMVLIDHGFGVKTLYGHLSKILVRQGQKVDRWKPIGLVGSTGLSTGPHLHYELRKDGTAIDPLSYILN